jgi:hypothetical protein
MGLTRSFRQTPTSNSCNTTQRRPHTPTNEQISASRSHRRTPPTTVSSRTGPHAHGARFSRRIQSPKTLLRPRHPIGPLAESVILPHRDISWLEPCRNGPPPLALGHNVKDATVRQARKPVPHGGPSRHAALHAIAVLMLMLMAWHGSHPGIGGRSSPPLPDSRSRIQK